MRGFLLVWKYGVPAQVPDRVPDIHDGVILYAKRRRDVLILQMVNVFLLRYVTMGY